MSHLNFAYGRTLIISKYDDDRKDFNLGLDYCSPLGNKKKFACRRPKYRSLLTGFNISPAYRRSLKLYITDYIKLFLLN